MSEPTNDTLKPAMSVETPQGERVETLTSEKRTELTKKSEELRRIATDTEARKQEVMAGQAQEEAKGATIQERITAMLGKRDILNVIREEGRAEIAAYERQIAAVKKERASIEAQLSAAVSAPEVSSPSPEVPVAETFKERTSDLTQEAAPVATSAPETVPANDTTPPPPTTAA